MDAKTITNMDIAQEYVSIAKKFASHGFYGMAEIYMRRALGHINRMADSGKRTRAKSLCMKLINKYRNA